MNADDVRLVKTCEACPEQYDALALDGSTIGYLRLRFGEFSVRVPDVGGEAILITDIGGGFTGTFENEHQRRVLLALARSEIAKWHTARTTPEAT